MTTFSWLSEGCLTENLKFAQCLWYLAKPLLCAGRFISTKFNLKMMKTLADGFEVSARSYYYLLDWNEVNEWEYMVQEFGKSRLMDLTRVEYKRLFNKATTSEMNGW